MNGIEDIVNIRVDKAVLATMFMSAVGIVMYLKRRWNK